MKIFSVFWQRALVFGFACFLTSCVTRGLNFSSDYSWLKKGTTTKEDVFKVLGEPYLTGNTGGKQTWTYGFYKMRLFGASNTKELKIYWEDGKLDTYSFNSSFPEDKRKAMSTVKK